MQQVPPEWAPPADWFIYLVLIVIFVGIAATFAAVARRLGESNWSLADALSEETDVTVADANGKPYTVNGAVVKQTLMTASSSRLIAFVGMISILFLFIGFGAFILWGFARTGVMPAATAEITKFLVGGMTLFAPYVVNKFTSMFAAK